MKAFGRYATVAGLLLIIAGCGSSKPTGASHSSAPASTTTTVTDAPVTAPPTTPAPQYNDAPTAADFGISARITENQCFDTAGASIQYSPVLAYKGVLPLDPSTTFQVTYVEQIPNGATHTVEVTGGKYSSDSQLVDTDNCPQTVALAVTAVAPE
jgi:PBP1b-binding outer membrane lipoprotein LpoB